ncbi:hypothetical protein NL676_034439 [Syzygium grande]|nr:hypothetical protein NL676_034439 [Syzygium grande]
MSFEDKRNKGKFFLPDIGASFLIIELFDLIVDVATAAKEINELWMEYEANLSPEAKVVKDFDKVEMILQALEYENEQRKDLDEFFVSTAGKFQTELGKAWASEIALRRKRQ